MYKQPQVIHRKVDLTTHSMFYHMNIIIVLLLSDENTTILNCKEPKKSGISGSIHFSIVLVINLTLLHAIKCLSFNQLRLIKHTSFVAQQAYSKWLALNSVVNTCDKDSDLVSMIIRNHNYY